MAGYQGRVPRGVPEVSQWLWPWREREQRGGLGAVLILAVDHVIAVIIDAVRTPLAGEGEDLWVGIVTVSPTRTSGHAVRRKLGNMGITVLVERLMLAFEEGRSLVTCVRRAGVQVLADCRWIARQTAFYWITHLFTVTA